MAGLNPKRVVAETKELRALTSNEMGNQRVAFTETWLKANDFFKRKLDEIGVPCRSDPAGNLWATLDGAGPSSSPSAVTSTRCPMAAGWMAAGT